MRRHKKLLIGGLIFVVCLTFLGIVAGSQVGPAKAKRPNIVMVLTDDSNLRDHDVVADMRPGGGFEWVRRHGIRFGHMWSTDNVCCPGRVTTLTGETPYNHGLFEANTYFKSVTDGLPSWLQSVGYDTGFAGHYQNLYPLNYRKPGNTPQEGWTYWEPLLYRRSDFDYNMMKRDGTTFRSRVFETDYLAQVARAQLKDSLDRDKPAFIALWPSAPHFGTLPKPGYARVPVPWSNSDPSFNEQDLRDKPPLVRRTAQNFFSTDAARYAPESARVRIRTLLSVDDALKAIIDDLSARNELKNTIFILTTDNGSLLGEHHLVETKSFAYEADQLPLWIAGPGFPAGTTSDAFVTNLDVAPTIARIAGVKDGLVDSKVDGRRMQDVLADPDHGHDRFLPIFVPNTKPTGEGVKTWRYKYINYADGSEELYDLKVDPDELESKHNDPAYATIKSKMIRLQQQAKKCKLDSCRIAAPPELQK